MNKTTPANCVSAKLEIAVYGVSSGDRYGFTNADDVSLTACIPLVIAGQPHSQVKDVGQTAVFSVVVTGDTPVYTCERKLPGGAFAPITGADDSTYTTPSLTLGDSGYQYRCKITNPCTTLYSDAVTLTVIAPARLSLMTLLMSRER